MKIVAWARTNSISLQTGLINHPNSHPVSMHSAGGSSTKPLNSKSFQLQERKRIRRVVCGTLGIEGMLLKLLSDIGETVFRLGVAFKDKCNGLAFRYRQQGRRGCLGIGLQLLITKLFFTIYILRFLYISICTSTLIFFFNSIISYF